MGARNQASVPHRGPEVGRERVPEGEPGALPYNHATLALVWAGGLPSILLGLNACPAPRLDPLGLHH